MKAIERIDKVESPKNLPPKIRMEIRQSHRSGNDILSAKICPPHMANALCLMTFPLRQNDATDSSF